MKNDEQNNNSNSSSPDDSTGFELDEIKMEKLDDATQETPTATDEEFSSMLQEKAEDGIEKENLTLTTTNKDTHLMIISSEDTEIEPVSRVKRVLSFASAGIIGAYLIGVMLFSFVFMPNTKINGMDVSFKSAGKVNELLTSSISEIDLEYLDSDGKTLTENLPLEKTEYSQSIEKSEIDDFKTSLSPFLWVMGVFKSKETHIDVTESYNKPALSELLNNSQAIKAKTILPENAYLELDKNGYVLYEEVLGNKVDTLLLENEILNAIKTSEKKINLKEKNCYISPSILSNDDNMERQISNIDVLRNVVITYDFDDREEILRYEDFYTWLQFDENHKLTVDNEGPKAYIDALALKYDTLGKAKAFTTTEGIDMMISGGIYGWQINRNKSVIALQNSILEEKSVTITPEYTSYGISRNVDEIGETYIEIDLTTQHMWYYINGELYVETPIVSGLPYDGRATPTGVFNVWIKETDRFLTGADYKLHVDMWMQIDWTGVGIHDAYWQPTFGEEHYKTRGRGSHGCINTPHAACKKIFEKVEFGTPVVIYQS